jgi:hypothetical protein
MLSCRCLLHGGRWARSPGLLLPLLLRRPRCPPLRCLLPPWRTLLLLLWRLLLPVVVVLLLVVLLLPAVGLLAVGLPLPGPARCPPGLYTAACPPATSAPGHGAVRGWVCRGRTVAHVCTGRHTGGGGTHVHAGRSGCGRTGCRAVLRLHRLHTATL